MRRLVLRRFLPAFTVLIATLGPLTIAAARPFRVDQIPNGSVNTCQTCHLYPGGPRNPFGQEIEDRFLDGPAGNVIWNASLAALDSDRDGMSNGRELQDPNGVWRTGQLNPGSATLVTQPGVPDAPKAVPALSAWCSLALASLLLCWGSRKTLQA